MSKMKKECRVVFTDLDGTLLGSNQKLSNSNRQMLEDLGQREYCSSRNYRAVVVIVQSCHK